MIRRAARALASTVAAIGLLWVLTLAVTGGFDLVVAGIQVTAHDPKRPALFASLFIVVYILLDGRFEMLRRSARKSASLYRFLKRSQQLVGRVDHAWLAIAVAAATFVAGFSYATMTAAGADSYGYVSQADLWIQRDLKVRQPWATSVPWPNPYWSFSTLGYRPVEPSDGQGTIVPIYSPGLPLLMAVAKTIGGQTALFAVVPLLGSITVLATYGIGRRLGAPWMGVIAAILVATSPAFLFMLVAPLSDVAVAGAWSAAFFFLLGRRPLSAAAAGLCTAIAILVRPNLFSLAGVLGLWFLIRIVQAQRAERRSAILHAALFAICAAPGLVVVGLINHWLFGSATTSGYGGFLQQFAWKNIWPNVRNYVAWSFDTQTPLVLAGFVAIAWPSRRLWPTVADRRALLIAGLFVAAVWVEYCAYLVFDAWWFLRFLLSTWPFLMLGLAAAIVFATRPLRSSGKWIAAAIVGCLAASNVLVAESRGAFNEWSSERHFISSARLIRTMTPPNSVVIGLMHGGSVRYYAGRMTIRYDNIDPQWLDRSVDWLTAHGVHVYALLDEGELPEIQDRFVGQKLAVVFTRPIVAYEGPARAFIYDLSTPPPPGAKPQKYIETYRERFRGVPPAPRPTLTFHE